MKNKKWLIRIGSLLVLLALSAIIRYGQDTEQRTDDRRQEDIQQEDIQNGYTFRTQEQLLDHFERHGKEMGYDDPQAYEEGASRVVLSPSALHKLEEEDGDDVYYLEETNEFVIVSTDGYIRTYFCPDDGIDYYNRQ